MDSFNQALKNDVIAAYRRGVWNGTFRLASIQPLSSGSGYILPIRYVIFCFTFTFIILVLKSELVEIHWILLYTISE